MNNNDILKKYDIVFTSWNAIIDKMRTLNISEEVFESHIKSMWVQTVGGEPIVITVIIPNGTDSDDYDRYYKPLVIASILEVTGVEISDIYFITASDMEKIYEMYEEEERQEAEKR